MLHMFYTYVCKCFLSGCYIYFAMAFQVFSGIFAKVDRVLYISQCDSPVTAACCICWDTVHACGKQRDGARHGYRRRKRRRTCGERHGWSLLANNANKDWTRDTDFYIENPSGKKQNHGRQPAIFTIWWEFTERREYNESLALPVRLTRCIYRMDRL
jgi:hypothetical protein